MTNPLITEFKQAPGLTLATQALSNADNYRNQLAEKQVIDWLVQWISEGPIEQRANLANDFLKNNFAAALGLQKNTDIKNLRETIETALAEKINTLQENFARFSDSGFELFAGLQPDELVAIQAALKQVAIDPQNGVSNDNSSHGQQNIRLSELVSEIRKEPESCIRAGDTKQDIAVKSRALQMRLIEVLSERKSEFSAKFMGKTQKALGQLEEETKTLFIPVINSGLVDNLLDEKVASALWGDDLIGQTNEVLRESVRESYDATLKEVNKKLGPWLNKLDRPEAKEFLKAEIQSMTSGEKAVTLIKMREAKNIKDMNSKLGARTIGDFFASKNIMQFLTSTGLGLLLGGGIFGKPALGAIIFAALNFFGGLDEQLGEIDFSVARSSRETPPPRLEKEAA